MNTSDIPQKPGATVVAEQREAYARLSRACAPTEKKGERYYGEAFENYGRLFVPGFVEQVGFAPEPEKDPSILSILTAKTVCIDVRDSEGVLRELGQYRIFIRPAFEGVRIHHAIEFENLTRPHGRGGHPHPHMNSANSENRAVLCINDGGRDNLYKLITEAQFPQLLKFCEHILRMDAKHIKVLGAYPSAHLNLWPEKRMGGLVS